MLSLWAGIVLAVLEAHGVETITSSSGGCGSDSDILLQSEIFLLVARLITNLFVW